MIITKQNIKDAMNDLQEIYITDKKIADEVKGARHLRGGKITREDSRELKGTEVLALGRDELNNLIYIGKDGIIRQHIEN